MLSKSAPTAGDREDCDLRIPSSPTNAMATAMSAVHRCHRVDRSHAVVRHAVGPRVAVPETKAVPPGGIAAPLAVLDVLLLPAVHSEQVSHVVRLRRRPCVTQSRFVTFVIHRALLGAASPRCLH